MVFVRATVKGGLPVIAEVWYSGPDWQGEYDAGVDTLYWTKRDGSKGKEVSQAFMDDLEKKDQWWQSTIIEQANDWLGYNAPTRYAGTVVGEYTKDYHQLNPERCTDDKRPADCQ